MSSPPSPTALSIAASPRVVRVAARTSVVVGSLLNLVNQWYALFQDWRAIQWLPFALNYVVPYIVASVGAVSMARSMAKSGKCQQRDPP